MHPGPDENGNDIRHPNSNRIVVLNYQTYATQTMFFVGSSFDVKAHFSNHIRISIKRTRPLLHPIRVIATFRYAFDNFHAAQWVYQDEVRFTNDATSINQTIVMPTEWFGPGGLTELRVPNLPASEVGWIRTTNFQVTVAFMRENPVVL